MSEKDHLHTLLNGIDKDYDLIHATIFSKTESINVQEVQVMMFTDEKMFE